MVRVVISQADSRLNRRVKSGSSSRAAVTREEAIGAANAVLGTRVEAARVELRRRVGALRTNECRSRIVEDVQHGLLRSVRQIADMGGSFGFHALTAVGRSLEGYLLAIMGKVVVPDGRIVDLHVETLASFLGQDARGPLGDKENAVIAGLHTMVQRSLADAGISPISG